MSHDNNEEMNLLNLLQGLSNNQEDDENLYIQSVQDAYDKIKIRRGRYMERVVDYITDPHNNVYGNTDEYHNLCAQLFRASDYYSALRVCEFSLKRFPNSIDMLANAIRAAGECGEFDKAEEFMATANAIPKEYWNWRLFCFAIDMYKRKMASCAFAEINACYENAIALAEAYQKYLPWDERGFNQMAEILLVANKVDEARQTLEKAIDMAMCDDQGQPIRRNRQEVCMVAAQCCVTLIDDILDYTDEYDEIIRVANKGLQFTTQEQPSAHIGYFAYRIAMAMDAKIVRDNYNNRDSIVQALREYRRAYELNAGRAYAATIEKRYVVLSQNAINPIDNMPLKSEKTEDDD